MKQRICCIFNIGPHYRSSIYQLMDKELNCDFYFGDKVGSPIKIMDYSLLKGYKKTVKNKNIPNTGFTWQTNIWYLVFKNYRTYIITGSPGSLSNWILVILAIPLRKKVYAWTHGMKGNSKPFGKFLEKVFYKLCDKILLYGEYSKKIMLEEGFNEYKLVPIYNSLDYDHQLKVRKKLSSSSIYKNYFENDFPTLTYIGRIQKSKRIDLLIECLAILREKGVYCNLTIIGKDSEGNDVPDLVNKYKLEKNVWFYGPSYCEEEIGQLLYNSDLCVTPGLIGLTAIHSLMYGTPVITNDEYSKHGPEFEAIQPGITGDFFKKDDLQSLCSKIHLWINLDSKKRSEVRENAYQAIDKKYNPHFQIQVLKKLISN